MTARMAVGALAGLLLALSAAACTSAPAADTTTVTSTTAVPASSPLSSSASPSASVASVRSASSAAVSPSPSAAAALDPASAAWFAAVCTGQKDLQKLASPQTSGTVPQLQAQVAAAYRALSTDAARTAAALTGLAAPTMADGAAVKSVRVAVFRAISTGYARGATTIEKGHPTTTAQLEAAVTGVEQGIQATVGKIAATAPEYPSGYSALISALPACRGMA